MNSLEQVIYNLVKTNPRLKMRIRNIYQRLFDLLPARSNAAYPIEVREGFFFGFHDKCPWSLDQRMLLAHRYSIPLRMPKPDDTIEVGYFSGRDFKVFTSLGVTSAWNWHQGSMLQWLGESNNIVFNDFDGSHHIARIVNKKGENLGTLTMPVAAVSPNGKMALSYNFARLSTVPQAYGYANGEDSEHDKLIPSKDGLYLIDVSTGNVRNLFSIHDVAKIEPEPSMEGAFHYLTHCQFSPSGERFKFFHRWVHNRNFQWTRMISSDLKGNDVFVFPTSGMVSHVAWRDDNHILAYARTKKFGDKYYLFTDKTDEYSIIGKESFNSDGHPSFSKDGRWIITDTYPDRFRMRYLVLYDTKEKKRYNLARLYSPSIYSGDKFEDLYMCDLHPRWSRDDTMVCFDSAHMGKRALCTITLGEMENDRRVFTL